MTMLPAKTAISDTYPNPSNATARAGFAQMWDALNEFQQKSELDLASATTCDIGNQASTKLRITGTTGITSFGTNYRGPIMLRFAGAVAITHDGTTLRCPGSANVTTAANDTFMAWPTASVSGTLDGWRLIALDRVAPLTQGGTGATSASGAFTAIKQAATTSATGVVELATDAEAQAGTDATRCVTPDNLGATVLGIGQTWTDVKTSPGRAVTTTYTNSTGRAIVASVGGSLSLAGSNIYVTINGSIVAQSNAVYTNNSWAFVSGVIIPASATYSVTASAGTLASLNWWELR